MNKEERYDLLLRQIESLVAGETNTVGILANVSAAMKEMFPEEFFWVGFYLVDEEARVLRLGPFQGTVACYTIPYGRGVCGAAWAQGRTLVVPDVELFPGHIACSSLSRSEIVVPVKSFSPLDFCPSGNEGGGGEWLGGASHPTPVRGVIDIDSKELGTFDETDREWLERIACLLSEHL